MKTLDQISVPDFLKLCRKASEKHKMKFKKWIPNAFGITYGMHSPQIFSDCVFDDLVLRSKSLEWDLHGVVVNSNEILKEDKTIDLTVLSINLRKKMQKMYLKNQYFSLVKMIMRYARVSIYANYRVFEFIGSKPINFQNSYTEEYCNDQIRRLNEKNSELAPRIAHLSEQLNILRNKKLNNDNVISKLVEIKKQKGYE